MYRFKWKECLHERVCYKPINIRARLFMARLVFLTHKILGNIAQDLWNIFRNIFMHEMYYPFTTIPIPCVAWWRHQMEIFSALLTPLWGESSGHRRIPPLMFPLLCVWTNGWANNRNAGDLICHRAHYDVTIMISASLMTRDRFMQWLVLTWAPTLILDTINITVFVAQDLLPPFRNMNDNNCSTRKHHMTSSNGTFFALVAFCVGEFTGHRWILRKKASDADLWCFLWSALEPRA